MYRCYTGKYRNNKFKKYKIKMAKQGPMYSLLA